MIHFALAAPLVPAGSRGVIRPTPEEIAQRDAAKAEVLARAAAAVQIQPAEAPAADGGEPGEDGT